MSHSSRRGWLLACYLGLGVEVHAFLPMLLQRARCGMVNMQLSVDIIDNTSGRQGDRGVVTPAAFVSGRPGWFQELLMVKEDGVLRRDHELLRVDWDVEDDQVVDELVMTGKMEDARTYLEAKKAESVPVFRETLRYYWTQSESEIHVGVPVPRAVRGSSMHLVVAEDALQMALLDDPTFGVIAGKFSGEVDPATSGWQLVQRADGSYSVSMTLKKISQPGTESLWYALLKGEKVATCMKFRSKTDKYHWSQDIDYMNAFFPIPEGVKWKQLALVMDTAGTSMSLKYQTADGEQSVIQGTFCGVVSPEECSWVIDEDENGERCVCMSLRKRRRDTSEASWWSRLFVAEEDEDMPERKVMESQQQDRARIAAMLKEKLFRDAAGDDVEDVDEE